MDDGGKLDYNKNSKNKSLVLNTQSFTDEEVGKLSRKRNLILIVLYVQIKVKRLL